MRSAATESLFVSAREVCDRHGLPRPKRIVRLKRGEVNALFRLDFDQKNPLICKIWVRPSGPEVMELHVSTVSRIHRLLAECAQIMLILHTSGIEAPGPTDASAWAATEIDRHRRCIQALRQQGWFNGRTLERVECAWDRRAASLSNAGQLSLVHYDFQLHNLRVDPASLKVLSVLDFDYVTQAPPFTDARDLVLSVFLRDPGLADTFWQEYGVLDEGQQKILALHSLGRLLDILAAYGGANSIWLGRGYGSSATGSIGRLMSTFR